VSVSNVSKKETPRNDMSLQNQVDEVQNMTLQQQHDIIKIMHENMITIVRQLKQMRKRLTALEKGIPRNEAR
jgi:hypothetical protein